MSSRRQDLLLGLVSILILVLLVGTILFIEPLRAPATRQIEVHFRHDEGIAPIKAGSPVLLSGALEVGKVSSIDLEAADRTVAGDESALRIVVRAQVLESLQLYEDCQITTDAPPVGGGGVLTILSVGTPTRRLVEKPITGLPPQSFASAIGGLSRRLLSQGGVIDKLDRMLDDRVEGSLAYKISAILGDINAMTASLKTELSTHEEHALLAQLHRILDDINGMTSALRQQSDASDAASMIARLHLVLEKLASALGEAELTLAENRPALGETLKNVQAISRTLNDEMMPKLVRELDREDPAALMGKLHASMDSVRGSLDNLFEVTQTGRRVLVMNRPALERTITNLKDASDQLRVGVQELLLAPWRLFTKPGPGETQKLDAFEAARRFAEAATYLDDAAARLEAASNAPLSDSDEAQAEVAAIRESLQAAFERFRVAEEFFWEKIK